MAAPAGPLREGAVPTSKEPSQLSGEPRGSAALCWARQNRPADLVRLPLSSHWNSSCTFCSWHLLVSHANIRMRPFRNRTESSTGRGLESGDLTQVTPKWLIFLDLRLAWLKWMKHSTRLWLGNYQQAAAASDDYFSVDPTKNNFHQSVKKQGIISKLQKMNMHKCKLMMI